MYTGFLINSYFHIKLHSGEEKHERDFNWHSISSQKRVGYMEFTKTVFICNDDVQTINIEHEGQHLSLDVPAGHQVYQAIRSETLFTPNSGKTDRVIGRVVGLVKDDMVVEEYFINSMQNTILGFRA